MTPGKGFTITREVEPWRRWLHSDTARTHEEHRSISHYLPLARTPHASPICMTISPSAMAECKRILAIHIYRSALLPALVTAFVQFVFSTALCHQHFVPLSHTSIHIYTYTYMRIFYLFLHYSLASSLSLCWTQPPFLVYISRFLRLRFAPFSSTLRRYVQLALSSSSLSSVSSPKCGGAVVKGQKRGKGIESFVQRREPPSHGKIFALLSITSSGKLKFSVAVGQRSGDVLMTTIHVPRRTIRLIFIKCNAIELQSRLIPMWQCNGVSC